MPCVKMLREREAGRQHVHYARWADVLPAALQVKRRGMVTMKTALLRRPHLCAEAKAGNTTAPRPSLRRVLLWA